MYENHLVVSSGHPIPIFAERTPELDRLISFVRQWVPNVREEGTDDFDLFVEDALRMEKAFACWPHERLWVRQLGQPKYGARDNERAVNVGTGEERLLSDLAGAHIWGPIPTTDPEPEMASYVNRQGYSRLTAFKDHAGRFVRLCSALEQGDDGPIDRADVIEALRDAGDSAAVKIVAKDKTAGIGYIHQIASLSDTELWEAFDNCFGEGGEWLTYHFAATRDAYLVQSAVPMHYEYRLFVVDHEVAVGAGCIVDFTPLDSTGLQFDPRVQRVRDPRHAIVEQPDVVERLVEFGRMVARKVREEEPENRSYVLDVALGSNGVPLVVELNSLLNAGLYALSVQMLVEALATSKAFPRMAPRPAGSPISIC